MSEIILQTELKDIKFLRRGKVRDIYEIEDYLLIVATDRISAFDVILPNGIPDKGKVLTQISIYWFREMNKIISNHIVSTDVKEYPHQLHKYANILKDRSMIVRKAKTLPIECIVRGYLSGSGWKEYKTQGTVCGIRLQKGLLESARLKEPIFTPSTKTEEGHDINIDFEETCRIVGNNIAETVKDISLNVYKKASQIAEKKGIIIADTKIEIGVYQDKLILIDELFTPDSSRFWNIKDYEVGKNQNSFDKQIVRNHLLKLKWDMKPPAPKLPKEIVEKTSARYKDILKILTK